ncbi:MAG: MFS transporter [Mycobacterium sp.]|nr:MFS transporter [Mycobacterium sp.]
MNGQRVAALFVGWTGLRAVLHNGWWLVVSLYMVVDAGLTPSQLLAIAAAQGIAALTFEIPAGAFADVVSRKWSIVIAHGLMGTAMVTTGVFPSLWPLLLSQMLWGISWNFSSGADTAWITGELGGTAEVQPVLVTAARMQMVGAVVGLVVFGGIASVVGRQPAIIGAGVGMVVLGVGVASTFPETGFAPARTDQFRTAVTLLREGARLTRCDDTLLALASVTVCVNGASDSFGRIYPVQLVRVGFPGDSHGTMWYTVLGIAGFLTGIIALYVVGRRIHGDVGAKSTMIVVCGLGAGSVALLAFAPDLQWAVVAILVATGIVNPLIRTVTTLWVNRRTTDDVRAITHSFFAQAEYAGEICVAGTLAAIPATGGVVASLTAAAALFAASALIVTRARSRVPAAELPRFRTAGSFR